MKGKGKRDKPESEDEEPEYVEGLEEDGLETGGEGEEEAEYQVCVSPRVVMIYR